MSSALLGTLAAAAGFVAVSLLVGLLYLLCNCKESRTRLPQSRIRIPKTRPEPTRYPHIPSIAVDESASYDPSLEISMAELVRATKNFASDGIVGDGSFGLVYKARLCSGVTVAVKKLSKDAFQGFREFRAEMDTLGKLRHQNIVKILGYCSCGADRVLVYEFLEKGSLDQWLHDTSVADGASSEAVPPLSWETRTKIVRGVANGLKYLHELQAPIIHRDIKASNVLLDSEFEAHIADFGLARMVDASHSHVSTQVAGTMGYMPPEYKEGVTAATVKADVYSFGILMIEVATGRRPNWPIKMEEGVEVGLVQWARKMVAQNREMEMLDCSVRRDGLRETAVVEFFKIACLCSSEMFKERPIMSDVVNLLDQV
ncbi:phytosulfokine receptor 2-like [Malania oleifera]|uniref:phytosulfokine receptor 2-like n=1 Tax=Malania oleifera TaxID=397392 RepID=UPI0025ADBEF8|nr:phytosulfokine receptor 2-like [Malania oleifera]